MWKLFKKKKTRYPCYNHFDDLKQHYQQQCTKLSLSPHLRVLQKLKKARIKSRVSLRDLHLDDRHIRAFLDVLFLEWPGKQWKTVILKGNQITDELCSVIANVVAKHTIIEKIDLSANKISAEGVRVIHDAVLKRNVKLVLNLANNPNLTKKETKVYVLACRDLKEAHTLDPSIDTINDTTDLNKTTDHDISDEHDLTSFTDSTPNVPSNKTDLDTSREVNNIQNDDSFASTDPTTDNTATNMTNVLDQTTDPSTPKSQQQHMDLSGATDISQIPKTKQMQSSPLVSPENQATASVTPDSPSQKTSSKHESEKRPQPSRTTNRSRTPQSSRLRSPTPKSPNRSSPRRVRSRNSLRKTSTIRKKNVSSSTRTSQSSSRQQSPRPQRKSTPKRSKGAKSSPKPEQFRSGEKQSSWGEHTKKTTDEPVTDSANRHIKQHTPSTNKHSNQSAQTQKKKEEPSKSVHADKSLSRHTQKYLDTKKHTHKSASKRSADAQKQPANRSGTEPKMTSPSIRHADSTQNTPLASARSKTSSKNRPVIQIEKDSMARRETDSPHSPRIRTESAASASSQVAHYTSSPRGNVKRVSDSTLVYSPMTNQSRIREDHDTKEQNKVPRTPSTTSSAEGGSFVSPLHDPNRAISDSSPRELNAVSREISELSGVDELAMHPHGQYEYDDLSVDDMDGVLDAALDKDHPQLEEQSIGFDGSRSKRWIRPNIYKYRDLREKKKRIEQEEAEKQQPPPPKKKKLKRVKVSARKKFSYLTRTFALSFDPQHTNMDTSTGANNRKSTHSAAMYSENTAHVDHFQYETPSHELTIPNHLQSLAQAAEVNGQLDMSTTRSNQVKTTDSTEFPTQDSDSTSDAPSISEATMQRVYKLLQQPSVQYKQHEHTSTLNSDQNSWVREDSSHSILPVMDHLPEPLATLSLRAAAIHNKIPFARIFPESCFDTLRCLDLSFNSIRQLSDDFQYFTNLQVLSLRGNLLKSLSGLEHNLNLTQLDVAGNQLESAEYLEYMAKLAVLDISYNEIQTAAGLRMLTMNKQLHTLNVEGNPAHVRNHSELRVTLTTLLKDHLQVYNNEPSPMCRFKKRMEKRNQRLEEVRKKHQLSIPTSSIAKVDLSRRVSILERYAKDAEAKRKQRQRKEREEARKRREERKRQRQSKKKFYTKAKWQNLNTVPRLETPRYRSTDNLNHELNMSLKRSSLVLDSILEHASPRSMVAAQHTSMKSPRLSQKVNRSQKLFQSISKEVSDLKQNPPKDEDYNTEYAGQLAEVKEDLSATFMAFSTLKEYMNRGAHYSEILDLRKLLEDCSLFDPLQIDAKLQSGSIRDYVRRTNQTKEKLRILFDSYPEEGDDETGNVHTSERDDGQYYDGEYYSGDDHDTDDRVYHGIYQSVHHAESSIEGQSAIETPSDMQQFTLTKAESQNSLNFETPKRGSVQSRDTESGQKVDIQLNLPKKYQ